MHRTRSHGRGCQLLCPSHRSLYVSLYVSLCVSLYVSLCVSLYVSLYMSLYASLHVFCAWTRLPTTAPVSQVFICVLIRVRICGLICIPCPYTCPYLYAADMTRKAELYMRIGLFKKAAEAAIAAQDLEILASIRHKCTNPADMAVIDNLISQSGLT